MVERSSTCRRSAPRPFSAAPPTCSCPVCLTAPAPWPAWSRAPPMFVLMPILLLRSRTPGIRRYAHADARQLAHGAWCRSSAAVVGALLSKLLPADRCAPLYPPVLGAKPGGYDGVRQGGTRVRAWVLGTGGWMPTADRATMSVLVRDGDRALLLDAGTGASRLVYEPELLAGAGRLD